MRFDELDRPSEARSPNQALTSYAYSALTTMVTDALGHTHGERRDPRGALVERTDPNGGRSDVRARRLRPGVRRRDPAGNETRSTSISAAASSRSASRTSEPGPTATTRSAHRTAQVDARGTETRFTYDALGRMVRRDDGGSSTTWTWDTAPNGLGRIARVAAQPDGTAREESL